MSPEFEVVINKKTKKGELKVNLLFDENRRNLSREIIKAHIPPSSLITDKGYSDGLKTLQSILPPEIARSLLLAVINKDEGAYVAFKKSPEGKYNVIDKRLRDNYKNPFSK